MQSPWMCVLLALVIPAIANSSTLVLYAATPQPVLSDAVEAPPDETSGNTPTENANPIDVGYRKQLFIDQVLVESSRNIRFTMNSPVRDGRMLIVADQPWEQAGYVSVYSSILKEKHRIRVWYDLIEITGDGPYDHERRVSYAESKDGLYFVKPKLGLHVVGGSTANNVVLPTKIGGCAVWIDPNAPPEHRYKTQAKVYPSGEFHMHSSPDGLRWTLFSRPHPGDGGHDTQSIVFWDSTVNRYVLFTRYWAHRKDPLRRYRTVRRLESDDLKASWDTQDIVMAPDETDRATHTMPTKQPPVDFYGATVFPYAEAPSVMIMMAQTHWHWRLRTPLKGLGPSNFDVQLAVSRDGKNFQRLGDRQPFMANGRSGEFDSRYVWVLPNPIRMGDELWFYYAGSNRDHDGCLDPAAPNGQHLAGIGRAVLRLDGFVSADAPFSGGQLTTPVIRFCGGQLELNMKTSGGGSVQVELLDEQENPIRGFSRADSEPINGNSVRMPVFWNGSDDISLLAGRPVRLRFYMQDCRLYAFRFRPFERQ